ncbi:MAG: glycosyltransferase, partial [Candidatus Omnitrophota bacterium]
MVTVTKNTPSVSVIIPSYNGKHFLKECLSSLYELRYPSKSLDIKVVDNVSTDGTAQYVHRNFRKVQVLRNDENNFCKANNLGIKNSRGELVAFLNNDTQVEKDWLKALVESIEGSEQIGCVGSKVLFPDGRIQSAGHYEFPNFRWGDRGLHEPDIGQYETAEEVNSLSGSSVLFRRRCLDDVGYFDEDFIMYLEDVDIFLRCRKKNWKLLYVPASIVHHSFHGTVDEKSVRFYIERNRLLLIAKHFPQELSHALESKEYSLRNEELFNILPDLFMKLLKHHNKDSLQSTLKDFFASLKRVYNLSKDQIVQELNNSLADSRKQMSEDMQQEKARLESDVFKLKDNLEKNYTQLEELKKALTQKDALLQEISQIQASLEVKVNQKEQDLTGLQEKLNRLSLNSAHREEKFSELQEEREALAGELSGRSEELLKEHQVVDTLK